MKNPMINNDRSQTVFKNPILSGFNPDPSIVRVGEDYYIVTSTFEWYPGAQIHHSRDLVNWRLVTRPLDRASQLDMRGNPDSGGVWAPCLSWHDGRFWLAYSDVKRMEGAFRDAHNYLITAPAIEGPWSDPIYLNASGFDPSLFHDEDGRKWLLNMTWDHRGGKIFGGICLQQYDPKRESLVGPVRTIFEGSSLGITEAPHLYRRKGWYYLLTAEGGTGYGHAITLARSRRIEGPYMLHPENPLLTTRDQPQAPLQRCGHGDLVETPAGVTWLVHLCGRPLPGTRSCILGRETALQKAVWGDDDWLRLTDDGEPALEIEAPELKPHPFNKQPNPCVFTKPNLPDCFQWLRTPYPDRIFSLKERPGYLRLFGRESMGSWFEQALVARRLEHTAFEAVTAVHFRPRHFQQMAGLVCYYNREKFHYLYITAAEEGERILQVMSCQGNWPHMQIKESVTVPLPALKGEAVYLRARSSGGILYFGWSLNAKSWSEPFPGLDMTLLSDEAGRGEDASFTGTFIGMACQDLAGTGLPADFAMFSYVGNKNG